VSKSLWVLGAVTAAVVVSGCIRIGGLPGSGHQTTDNRKVEAFSKVRVEGFYELDATCGQPQDVSLAGDDNLLSHVQTVVQDGTLRISSDQPLNPTGRLRVEVFVPTLTELDVLGTVDAKVQHLKASSFTLDLSGAGSVALDGSVDSFTAQMSGAASLQALDLHAVTAHVNMSGAGSAKVYATDTLDASLSGAGSIEYGGNPKNVHPSVSGVGTVKKLN
jgi:hypothetical protein